MSVARRLRRPSAGVAVVAAAMLVFSTVGLVTPASAAGFEVSGQVTAASGPAEGVVVEIFDLSGSAVDQTQTSEYGGFAFFDLPSGTYKVELFDSTNRYRAQFYGGAHQFGQATKVIVTATDLELPTVRLAENPSISGHFLTAGGAPVENAELMAYDDHGDQYPTEGGDDGSFRVWVDPGTYRLAGSAGSLGLTTYFPGWYANAEGFVDATPVAVRAGASAGGLRFVLYSTLKALGRPKVSGPAVVGHNLTADRGRWTVRRFVDFKYQWLRGATPIAGATAPSYALRASDVGRVISVRVTGTLDQPGLPRMTDQTTSVRTAAVVKARFRGVKVKITGKHRVHAVLNAHTSHVTGATLKYQWLRDGKSLEGHKAHSATYRPNRKDAGHMVSVRVRATRSGYVAKVAKSKAVRIRRK